MHLELHNSTGVLSPVRGRFTQEAQLIVRRHRFKQTSPLSERLESLARLARDRAAGAAPGVEREQLLKRAREAERAMQIDQWLTAPVARGRRPSS